MKMVCQRVETLDWPHLHMQFVVLKLWGDECK